MPTLATAIVLIGSYLLGSIPFGVLLTRWGGAGDLRQIGSGNIGATNVLRTGRKGLAAATLLLDGAKGAVAVLIVRHFAPGLEVYAAGASFLGHLYPVWLGFRGGKGVATMLGVSLAIYWPGGVAFAVVWIAMFAITRISSLGGMSASVAPPVVAAMVGRSDEVVVFLGMTLLVLFKHRENIARLLNGTEPKSGGKKPE